MHSVIAVAETDDQCQVKDQLETSPQMVSLMQKATSLSKIAQHHSDHLEATQNAYPAPAPPDPRATGKLPEFAGSKDHHDAIAIRKAAAKLAEAKAAKAKEQAAAKLAEAKAKAAKAKEQAAKEAAAKANTQPVDPGKSKTKSKEKNQTVAQPVAPPKQKTKSKEKMQPVAQPVAPPKQKTKSKEKMQPVAEPVVEPVSPGKQKTKSKQKIQPVAEPVAEPVSPGKQKTKSKQKAKNQSVVPGPAGGEPAAGAMPAVPQSGVACGSPEYESGLQYGTWGSKEFAAFACGRCGQGWDPITQIGTCSDAAGSLSQMTDKIADQIPHAPDVPRDASKGCTHHKGSGSSYDLMFKTGGSYDTGTNAYWALCQKRK